MVGDGTSALCILFNARADKPDALHAIKFVLYMAHSINGNQTFRDMRDKPGVCTHVSWTETDAERARILILCALILVYVRVLGAVFFVLWYASFFISPA